MANKHILRSPMRINDNDWYYEEMGGINIIHIQPAVNHNNEAVGKTAVHIKISWRKLRASLRRKDLSSCPRGREGR